MQLYILSILVALASNVVARPASSDHVVHEKRNGPSNWTPQGNVKPDGRSRLPVKIGLKERNIDSGDQLLMDIADPASKDYGLHMNPEQVDDTPTPSILHCLLQLDCSFIWS